MRPTVRLSSGRSGATRTWTLPILAGIGALVLFSCSDHNSATSPISGTAAYERTQDSENQFPDDDLVTQPSPPPGKGDVRVPQLDPLPDGGLDSLTPRELEGDDGRFTPDLKYDGDAKPGTTTRTIDGTLGGSVERGAFRVDVPPNAVDGVVDFKLEIPADGAVRVHLSPHGMIFKKPVVLTLDLSNTVGLGKDVTLYWWNEKQTRWDVVGGVYDPATNLLVAKLHHFSTYAPGRAGWKADGGKSEDSDEKKDNKEKK